MRNPNCTRCRLHETARTVCVASRGSPTPSVLFVGEAPGAEEDQQGKAFVGPAGQLLEQAIKEYGLTPCFISNIVRCQPLGNRQPRVDEVEACLPYLKEEIKRLRPKFVVILGNTALKALTGLTGINSFSGTVVKTVGEMQVFALYHPAFILRVPGMLPKFEMHLRELQRLVKGEAKKKTIPVLDVAPRDAFDLLSKAEGMVAFDYETSGLFKQQGGRVRAVGFYDGSNAFVVSAERHPDLPKLMKWFLKSDVPKVAYSSAFEIRWSIEEYGEEPANLIHDPQLMAYLLDENASRDLEAVASKYLSADRWDISGYMLEKGWDYATIPYENLVNYCGLDCYWTWKLAEKFNTMGLGEHPARPYSQILLPLARLCANLEITGIKLDQKWAKKIDMEYEIEQGKSRGRIEREDVIRAYTKMKQEKDKQFTFNPGSSMQLRDVLGKLGMYTDKKTKKGGLMSTDEETMEKFRGKHPFIKDYLDWKSITTRRNNFTMKFPAYCDDASVIHPHFNPIGTVTGRPSATEPPVLTFPRPEEDEDEQSIAKVRGMVISRFKGGSLVSSDYSQIELRLLANESQEEAMLEAFEKGQDLHGLTATRIFGKNFTKVQRSIGKTINFAIGYGIQAKALSRKFNVPYETADVWINQFWKGYRALYLWTERLKDSVKANGYVVSRFGRVRHLPEAVELAKERYPSRDTRWKLAALLRQACNFPIQSAGADINNLACIKLARQIAGKGLDSKLCLPIYDSIMVDTTKAERTQIKALCRGIMEDQMQKECTWMKVKLKVDQGVARRWGN